VGNFLLNCNQIGSCLSRANLKHQPAAAFLC
jgi:hypothetical protein